MIGRADDGPAGYLILGGFRADRQRRAWPWATCRPHPPRHRPTFFHLVLALGAQRTRAARACTVCSVSRTGIQ
jgi:hypothetical protein